MKRGGIGRADLLRALADADPTHDAFVAAALGFDRRAQPAPSQPKQPSEDAVSVAEGEAASEVVHLAPGDMVPMPFWRPDAFALRAVEGPEAPSPPRPIVWRGRPVSPPTFQVLAPWRDLLPRLRRLVGAALATDDVDVDGVVHALSRGRQLDAIPRLTRRRWARRLQVIVDRSDRLTPYWDDQDLVARALTSLAPEHAVEHGLFHETLEEPRMQQPCGGSVSWHAPDPGGVVLVLGDLGSLDPDVSVVNHWHVLGRRIAAAGCRAAALLPCPPDRCPATLRSVWSIEPWERSVVACPTDPDVLRLRAERLLRRVSPAVRIEPGLLRAVRRSMDAADADAGTEVDVWQHAAIASRSSDAATLHRARAAELRAAFDSEDTEVQQGVLNAIRTWRARLPQEIWYDEIMNLCPAAKKLLDPGDLEDARAFLTALRDGALGDRYRSSDIEAWVRRVSRRLTPHGLAEKSLMQTIHAYREREPGYVPRGDPIWYPPRGPERLLRVVQRGQHVVADLASASDVALDAGSPLGLIRSSNGYLQIWEPDEATADRNSFWAAGAPPAWAHDWGTDIYGLWVTFRIWDRTRSWVEQRLRWIPPGRFQMGSLETEEGRYDDEGPQHEVIFADGFWLFDTACTEALWEAVMGQQPEPRRGARFPVTDVSWDDAHTFIHTLNMMLPGIALTLPSEAQWEYACRAGTQTPYSFGTTITREQVCYDSSGPVEVGSLPANGWGLHEMHGNVWEWCEDHWHDSYQGAPTDGSPWIRTDRSAAFSRVSANRILRGGSWDAGARRVRAAYRSGHAPAYRGDLDGPTHRDNNLGFRCARVQTVIPASGMAPAAPASRASAERGQPQGPTSDTALLRVGVSTPAKLPSSGTLIIRTDCEEVRLGRLIKPEWASAIGRDRYGLFVNITLPETDITQRLRWCPPGRFQMGSSKTEEGRDDDEGLQHEVTLAAGFWLFDTPCTQALWEAVIGNNPSRFRSPTRPVENVSFNDVQAFLEKLNARMPGLGLGLPSEAQWEYACRAGTTTATYAGEMRILGKNNVPVLDAIAWYSGNSGVGFELSEGEDSSRWPQKQYNHPRTGTRPVGQKIANAWGLYDMLGDVWEWCTDHWHGSYEGAPTNGSPWIETDRGTARRVARGGSWRDDARHVRAASRAGGGPANHDSGLGFRCARAQSNSAVSAMERAAISPQQEARSRWLSWLWKRT